MAGAMGLEPTAFCVTGRRYNQLNYAPTEDIRTIESFQNNVKRWPINLAGGDLMGLDW